MSLKICPRCRLAPKEAGQGYCKGCRREYQRGQYRRKVGREVAPRDRSLTADILKGDRTKCPCCQVEDRNSVDPVGLCLPCTNSLEVLSEFEPEYLKKLLRWASEYGYFDQEPQNWNEAVAIDETDPNEIRRLGPPSAGTVSSKSSDSKLTWADLGVDVDE